MYIAMYTKLGMPPADRRDRSQISSTLRVPGENTQLFKPPVQAMDTAINLSDASKALDLANIRFQLM